MPQISIIVPVYNAEKYLAECIDSILGQSFADFELLLVNDGSTDSSPAICHRYALQDKRIKVLEKSNGGVSSARNLGLANATGTWIAFIDNDDWIDPSYLGNLLNKAIADKAEVAFCDFYFANPDGSKKIYNAYSWEKQGLQGLNDYMETVWTVVWAGLFKRSLISDHNLKFPVGITFFEDFYFISRLYYYANKVAKINLPLYYYRQIESSAVHNLNDKSAADALFAISDTIRFFNDLNCYENLKRPLCWRVLQASQEMILRTDLFGTFRRLHPQKKQFIFSCPFLNRKQKIMAYCLTHRLQPLTYFLVKLRSILGR